MAGDQGRCWARQAAFLASTLFVCLQLLLQFKASEAATFTVGDDSGWTYDIQSWADGKMFNAGGTLVFNYDTSLRNVAIVDAGGYKSCEASSGSKTYSSGKDKIQLKKGQNYFICSIPGHCDGGLKIAVNAS